MKKLFFKFWYWPVRLYPEEEKEYWKGQYDGSMLTLIFLCVLAFIWGELR